MRHYLLLILISFSIITLSSCDKEQHYSCDPEIDNWIKNNLSTIETELSTGQTIIFPGTYLFKSTFLWELTTT